MLQKRQSFGRRKLVGGNEYDTVLGRHIYCYLRKAGAARYSKKKINRRERKVARLKINNLSYE